MLAGSTEEVSYFEVVRGENSHIGRNLVTVFELHNVTDHELSWVDLDNMALSITLTFLQRKCVSECYKCDFKQVLTLWLTVGTMPLNFSMALSDCDT